jgi:hypothetical protein
VLIFQRLKIGRSRHDRFGKRRSSQIR